MNETTAPSGTTDSIRSGVTMRRTLSLVSGSCEVTRAVRPRIFRTATKPRLRKVREKPCDIVIRDSPSEGHRRDAAVICDLRIGACVTQELDHRAVAARTKDRSEERRIATGISRIDRRPGRKK